MRPIDADALETINIDGWGRAYSEFEIEFAPTIDAVPVVHGRWVDLGFVGDKHYYGCDICHAMEEKKTLHCPTCGARMDGEEAQQ